MARKNAIPLRDHLVTNMKKTGLFRTPQRGKGEVAGPPTLPQQARPLWSLFPVCLPGKDHVTNPEGNADIIVFLSHMCSLPPSLPPSQLGRIPASILPASLRHRPPPPTTHVCSHLFLCLSRVTLPFVFLFLVGCLLSCLGHTHTDTLL